MSSPILAKIKALLAKTTENGCTEAEAFSALAKAAQLMQQYSISPEALLEAESEKAGFSNIEPDTNGIRALLRTAIAFFTDCKAYQTQEHGGTIVFVGLQSDRDLALWLLESLSQFVGNEFAFWMLDNYDRSKHNAKALATGFIIGATERISERLRQLKREMCPESAGTALVVAKKGLIAQALEGAGIRLSRSREVAQNFHGEGRAAGHATGDRASFGRPVGSGGPLMIGRGQQS